MGWGGNAFGPVADKGKKVCCRKRAMTVEIQDSSDEQMRGRVMLKAQIETNK